MNLPTLLMSLFLSPDFSHAAVCELTIDRRPCPGKRFEAYQPYEGQNPSVETLKIKSEKVCLIKAEKAAKVLRKDVVMQKTVTAKFDGEELDETFVGKSDCQ